jgi:hypothetical protein
MHLRAFAVETAGSIIYSECVVVALGMQTVRVICMPPYCTVICALPGPTTCFHNISQTARFSKIIIDYKNVRFDFLYRYRLKYFSF